MGGLGPRAVHSHACTREEQRSTSNHNHYASAWGRAWTGSYYWVVLGFFFVWARLGWIGLDFSRFFDIPAAFALLLLPHPPPFDLLFYLLFCIIPRARGGKYGTSWVDGWMDTVALEPAFSAQDFSRLTSNLFFCLFVFFFIVFCYSIFRRIVFFLRVAFRQSWNVIMHWLHNLYCLIFSASLWTRGGWGSEKAAGMRR